MYSVTVINISIRPEGCIKHYRNPLEEITISLRKTGKNSQEETKYELGKKNNHKCARQKVRGRERS